MSKLNALIGVEGSIFRDSALTNVVEGIELAKKLVIDAPPELEAVVESLAKTVTKCVDGKEALRNSSATREAAAKKLAEIEAKMPAFSRRPDAPFWRNLAVSRVGRAVLTATAA